ncbi:cell division protein FtsZ [Solitalea sp. MAHUQ-68]|uniref:Cell division protein FtsZ n=1 Tax=Solitalea agri TaxID=2953739 RepID=A0A9X2F1H4_9SPHI|nr:cell division protein FtsZ [Solitalea agri]MCO4292425.1 cell division protein FtsZ [Solitalea agri]
MEFEMYKEKSSIIKVIGVGGGGGNAVNHMYRQGIKGVDFIICNTDAQALELSPIPNKVQLGASLTEGRGAGSIPEVGRNSAIENVEQLREMLGSNTKMVFITAGMGGGTGTGASPIIAKAAKDMGILTVGIVTTPFKFEGPRRKVQADQGLEELKKNVDTLLVISNEKVRQMCGNLELKNAFAQADNVLTTASKGIAEIITVAGYINVDFEDVKTVMKDSGVAIMGSCAAEGENRARKAVEGAMASPLLNDNEIEGARYILLNITSGVKEVLMDEVSEITDYIQSKAGATADIIWGNCNDESLGEAISVTLIATGFNTRSQRDETSAEKVIVEQPVVPQEPERIVINLNDDPVREAESFVNTLKNKSLEPSIKVSDPEPQTPKINVQTQPAPSLRQVSMFDLFGVESNDTQASNHTFEFTVSNKIKEEPKVEVIEQPEPEVIEPINFNEDLSEEELMKKSLQQSRDRIMKLKNFSIKLNSNNGLNELENVPAYVRKNMKLKETPHSSEQHISRFTLSNDNDGTEIRPNNSFLHDNVD